MTTTPTLPDGTVLLHIGPQKTGSTAIQSSMHENRAELAAQGVLYPGDTMRPQAAGWAVMGTSAMGRPIPDMKAWHELLDEIRSTSLARTCLSNEDFGRADDAAVERIMTDLGSENVHLVFVARRLDKLLPSHWQERVKARVTKSYDEFLHHVLDTPDIDWEARVTWEPHDVGLILERWARFVPREQMTVIVSDEKDRALIPTAFEYLLGLNTGTLKPSTTNTNTSLTFTQTEIVRRLNMMVLNEKWSTDQYWRIMQSGVIKALRNAGDTSRPGDPKITGLPAWAYALVAERAEAQVAAITASGARVIGDPSRLLLPGNAEPAELPETPESIPLDVVADLVSGAVEGTESLHRRDMRAAVRKARKEGTADELSGRELVRVLSKKAKKRIRGQRSVRRE